MCLANAVNHLPEPQKGFKDPLLLYLLLQSLLVTSLAVLG